MSDLKRENGPPRETHDRILRAALEEFAEHGLAGARVDRIARRADVNKAMIYYHFTSKEKLYDRVVEDHFEKATSDVHEHLAPDQPLAEQLKGMAAVYARIATDRPRIFQLLLRELANPESRILKQAADFITASGIPSMILDRIKKERAAGDLRDIRAKHAICSFVAMNIGYIVLAPLLNQAFDIKDSEAFLADRADAVVDLFLNGVLKR